MFDRRTLIGSAISGVAASAFLPRIAWAAAPTAKRFVFIIQRGAADGLHIVPPLGDPGYASLRGPMLAALEGASKIDSIFSLHPALARTRQLFAPIASPA